MWSKCPLNYGFAWRPGEPHGPMPCKLGNCMLLDLGLTCPRTYHLLSTLKGMEQHPATPTSADQSVEVQIHSAPKFWPFILTFAVLGALVGLVIGLLGEPSQEYTRASASGFFAMFGAGLGVGIGALVFVIIDRFTSRKSTKHLAVPLAEDTDTSGQPG